ncbi:MAG: tetratricopeptide repeat protein [Planctomycetaceae bacterium]|nr:tetratricopeptide repeat protein [Planctomycetaceae bacterium]
MTAVAHPLDPLFEEALTLHRAGQFAAAAQRYEQMLASDPNYAKAWHVLGLVRFQTGDPVRAVEFIQRAIQLRNDNPVYYGNLGNILRNVGRHIEAVGVLERAVALDAKYFDARVALASSLTAICRAELAVPHFQSALADRPQSAEVHSGLAHALCEMGDADGARREYAAAQALVPSPSTQVLAATQLPSVYRSHADLRAWRERLEHEVDALLAAGVQVDLNQHNALPVFSLAHQGFNDVDLIRKIARLYKPATITTPPQRPPQAAGKIHVGFISAHFRDHTIGKLMRGFIDHLNRDDFYVTVFSIGFHDDETARKIRAGADQYVPLSADHHAARPTVAAMSCDVLFYTDIGMDQTTYALAFSRLAPVQCVSWGHPDTTGIETIDYFVSSELFESAEADAHYSEQLVRLPTLPFCYYPPELPSGLPGRAALGLDPAAHVYCCPQSIYKFHPDFDPVIAEILRRDPLGQLVLIQWIYPLPDEVLLERWRGTMPDVVDRVQFVPRMSQPKFMNLLASSDLLLDPLRFGGGNTSAEAIALGTPIVTLPDEFMRSRITAAFFRQMEIPELIVDSPESYIEQAVRLGTDRAYNAQIRERILAAHGRLYEDRRAVRALEDFFRRAVQGNRP